MTPSPPISCFGGQSFEGRGEDSAEVEPKAQVWTFVLEGFPCLNYTKLVLMTHSWICLCLLLLIEGVVIEGVKSHLAEMAAGMAQGSRLGPLLFVIFINDIVKDLKSDYYLQMIQIF